MNRPAPLVPANVDLTDFPFMPLMIARLKQSRAWLMCKRRPELAFYMINLWTASWHSRPPASLENDDDVLADIAMCAPKIWKAIKADVLRGWIECEDGRIYHPVVAEQALSSWGKKVAQRQRTEAARQAKASRRSGGSTPAEPAVAEHPKVPATERVTGSVTAAVTDDVTGSKGQYKGESRESPPIVPLAGDSPPGQSQPGKPKARGESLPADWRPKEAHYEAAAKLGFDTAWVDDEAEGMRAWARAEAHRSITRKANWDQAFHNRLRESASRKRPIRYQPAPSQASTNGAALGRPTSGPSSARAGIAAGLAALRGEPH